MRTTGQNISAPTLQEGIQSLEAKAGRIKSRIAAMAANGVDASEQVEELERTQTRIDVMKKRSRG